MEKVFVYGTLKQGNGLHMHLKDAKFLGDHITKPTFTMYSMNVFPGIVEGGDTAIQGEVYEVEDLRRLDAVEGYPTLYTRKQIPTNYGNAWVYLFNQKTDTLRVVESGVW